MDRRCRSHPGALGQDGRELEFPRHQIQTSQRRAPFIPTRGSHGDFDGMAEPANSDDPHPPRFYHGTRADLKPGDLVKAGHTSNYGEKNRTSYVYLTANLEAATWGAELSLGEGPGRIYIVEPSGPIMDDPNLTNAKYPGNPTRSYRSREPLLVTGEVTDWQGHPAETIQAMKDRIRGLKPIDN